MAFVNVDTSANNYGNAPAGTKVGDVVHTAGGDYSVVAPNTEGASYNPKSGLWSIKIDSNNSANAPSPLPSGRGNADATDLNNANQSAIDINDKLNQLMENNAQLANQISAFSSAQQYNYNREEAQKTRDWQEAMSSTAHQREVRDLLAAGLNPVLSSQLGGASTPAGATAQGSSYTGQKADVDTSLLPYMSSIIGSYLGFNSQQNVARIQQETALETAKINSATTMYAADKSSQAAMAAALEAAAASRYSADRNYEGRPFYQQAGSDLYNTFKEYANGHVKASDIIDAVKSGGKKALSWLFPDAFGDKK